jgi:gliding motility-associated-like protein
LAQVPKTITQPLECHKLLQYGGPAGNTSEYEFPVPPGQTEDLVYELYLYTQNVPDGVEVFVDNVSKGSAWTGFNCLNKTGTGGATEKDCRQGPLVWSNLTTGTGEISPWSIDSISRFDLKNLLEFPKTVANAQGKLEDESVTGILKMMVKVPKNSCMVKFKVMSSSNAGTVWRAYLKCPNYRCDQNYNFMPSITETSCTEHKLHAERVCPSSSYISWKNNNSGTTYTGNDVTVATPLNTSSLNYTLTANYGTCVIKNNLSHDLKNPPVIGSLSSTPATCSGVSDGSVNFSPSNFAKGQVSYNLGSTTGSLKPGEKASVTKLPPGKYTLTTSNAGCSQKADIEVKEGVFSFTSKVTDPSCYGEMGSVKISPSDKNNNLNYKYENLAGVVHPGTSGVNKAEVSLPKGKYKVTLTDSLGCKAEGDVVITGPSKVVLENLVASEHCDGGIEFTGNVKGGTQPYVVKAGNIGIARNVDNSFSGGLAHINTGSIKVQANDANGCTVSEDVQSEKLTLHAKARRDGCDKIIISDIEIRHGNTVVKKIEDQLLSESKAKNNYSYKNSTLVLTQRADNGCDLAATLAVTGEKLISEEAVYTPNIFSPNGDGANDVYTVGLDRDSSIILKSLKIFDRWGNLVADKDNPNKDNAWDGTFKENAVQQGVFVGLIEMSKNYCKGVTSKISFDISVIR